VAEKQQNIPLNAKKFYKSASWQKCRDAYFNSQHGICERCGNAGKIVHHTAWLTPDNIDDPMISLNHELLELSQQRTPQHSRSTSI